jgi:uncharacterized protein YjbI with pentapeptide repeats
MRLTVAKLDRPSHRKEPPRQVLKTARLDGAVLWETDLRGADLSGASLSGAQLFGAHLACANLVGASLGPRCL